MPSVTRSPSTVVSTGTGFGWTNPENATAEDGATASVASGMGFGATARLRATYPTFDVPGGATVTGWTARIKRSGGGAIDHTVQIGRNSGGSDNKASGATWPGSLTFASYGGESDDWNAALDASDANSGEIVLDLRADDNGSATDAAVDFLELTVHYTEDGGGGDPPTDPQDNSHVLQAARLRSQALGPEKNLGHAWW